MSRTAQNRRALASAISWAAALVVAIGVSASTKSDVVPEPVPPSAGTADPVRLSFADPEVRLGDRLFFETRFAQFFHERSGGDVNAPLPGGDPVVNEVESTRGSPLPGPFRGRSMNCRHCHLGSDFLPDIPLAGRTYGDFSRFSEIPARNDGHTQTPRNSPLMVGLSLPREVPMLLHYDGEFASFEDLVVDTMTGRNFGWLPDEVPTATAHIAKVIREDEGVNPRYITYFSGKSEGHGVPYRVILAGTDPDLPADLRIPHEYRIDVEKASDEEILWAVAKLMRAYSDSLRFGTKNTFREQGSPYDAFLVKNGLPTRPASGETEIEYARRLRGLLDERDAWDWVSPRDGELLLHRQRFVFGPTELTGLKVFLAEGRPTKQDHAGNCILCHTPPQFTDHRLHNNGASQSDYDAVFGEGSFAALDLPDLDERLAQADSYLPTTPKHPKATGRFKAAPTAGKPGYADLGVWNVYANPDMPKPQAALTQILCGPAGPAEGDCRPEAVLPLTVAYFKTPSIRDLGQSWPYLHSGRLDTVEEVLEFYRTSSDLARAGKLRNGSREMPNVRLAPEDVMPLAAFLRSLNEDYH
ncbi:MAG: hypothetical protein FJ144_23330 [Deltaproteobacteria bacterium]|nr:hypothetical protein [Deltaproteobacteria bacterium]